MVVTGNNSSPENDNSGKEIGKKGKNVISEEDVDAPLQSGVVRVFKQPGIETHSDEDDFIQVRSKRQMINDRREQREREIKAKSRVIKPPWKPRARQNNASSASQNKLSTPHQTERVITNKEASTVASGVSSQQLAPIRTPSANTEPQFDKSTSPSKNVVTDNLTSWGPIRINQEVMTLTQTQLEDAMKSVAESTLPFSSSPSPINSLLAGELILAMNERGKAL